MSKRINSRTKGKTAELEFTKLLQSRKLCARRGQQYAGGTDSPDVICESLTNIHWEVKRVEAGNPYVWLKQAIRDAKDNIPVVAHRRNQEDWVAIVRLEDLLDLLILREGMLI